MHRYHERVTFRMDPDWKPERRPVIQVQPAASHSQSGSNPPQEDSLSNLLAESAPEIYEGVMGIIELEPPSPEFSPRFIVILDTDKELMRFPFGKLESYDASTARGADRETKEEVGIEIYCTQKNYVGTIDFGNCLFHIFHKKVPHSTSVTLGEEQEAWGSPTAEKLDSWVKNKRVTIRHARSWELFKQWRLTSSTAA